MTEHALPVHYSTLTPRQRREVREQYIRAQDGLCLYCRAPLADQPPQDITELPIIWSLFPPHFLAHPIHLQHNHTTDLTEGAVHAYCNAVLWQYEGH